MIPKRIFGLMVEERARTRMTPASLDNNQLKNYVALSEGGTNKKYVPNKKKNDRRN